MMKVAPPGGSTRHGRGTRSGGGSTQAAGHEPDSQLDPASLNAAQRKMLKESFAVINQLQEFMEQRSRSLLVA